MVNCVNSNASAVLHDRFQAKAAKFKELTGREIVNEKNENGDFIHMLHPESTQRFGFMVDFFRVGFNSPDGFEAAVENLSRKYAELREELLERYGDNQYELYKQLGELNRVFENALQSTVLLPLQSPPPDSVISSNMPQSLRNSIKRDWQEYESVTNFMQILKQNMTRHLNTFFETFIKNIQSADFDSAFSDSMETLNSGESRSLSDMSFRDTALIRDILHPWRFEEEERDGEVIKPVDSLRQAIYNTNISNLVRQELADLLGKGFWE
jgi:archaellum component FlaC